MFFIYRHFAVAEITKNVLCTLSPLKKIHFRLSLGMRNKPKPVLVLADFHKKTTPISEGGSINRERITD
jgi:hypothetical protein